LPSSSSSGSVSSSGGAGGIGSGDQNRGQMSGGSKGGIMMLPASDSHPDMVAAGFWGRFVFRELVRVCGQFDFRGRIPRKYATPQYLSLRAGCTGVGIPDPDIRIGEGIESAIATGLIVSCSDCYEIPGWERFYDSHADRQARYRKKKSGVGQVASRDVTSDASVIDSDTKTRRDETKTKEASSEASSEPASRQQSTGSATGDLAVERVEIAAPLAPPDDSPVVAVLPCVGSGPKEFHVTAKMCAAWTKAYPAVDVMAEVGRAAQWCVDNPSRRNTAKGARSFLGRWMAKQQDSGRANAFSQAPTARVRLLT